MNRLRFISQVLYRLKRRYGEPCTICQRTSSTTDLETGVKTVHKTTRLVNRVIVLPSLIHREFQYDLTFIATNKNFTYGGLYDTTERRLIFDRKDLGDFEITRDMYLLFAGRRYEIKQIEEFEERTAYFVVAKGSLEAHAETITTLKIGNDVAAEDGGSNAP